MHNPLGKRGLRLGKLPAKPGALKLKFRKYANLSVLPTPPATFGHDSLVMQTWEMFGNDKWGDCFWAGAAHQVMLWRAEAGVPVIFDTAGVLADYGACTGFDPAKPNSDRGTNLADGSAYWQSTGIVDAAGVRHKVAATLELTAGDLQEHLVAAYLFGTVGVGITFPESAMQQFDSGQPWTVVPGSPIEGGHYVPLVARRGGMCVFSTWGAEVSADDAFFSANNDESVVYLDEEMLLDGKSLEGFDLAQLRADLAELGQ